MKIPIIVDPSLSGTQWFIQGGTPGECFHGNKVAGTSEKAPAPCGCWAGGEMEGESMAEERREEISV